MAGELLSLKAFAGPRQQWQICVRVVLVLVVDVDGGPHVVGLIYLLAV